jgi:small subunit ribosomal protein S4
MARYTEAVCRLCRRSGDKLMLKGSKCIAKCTLDRRPKPPGPQMGRRRRLSDRGEQWREKQKVRYSYGVLERQFKRIFTEAEKKTGITGENLLVLLERRLDNVVYRLGFADSRSQARQLVQHGHFDLNGHKTDIPSCFVKEGDVISWHGKSVKCEYHNMLAKSIGSKTAPGWLNLDKEKLVGKVLSLPTPDDIDAKYNLASVVEYYSR